MTFKEALKILNIEDYGERIFKSSSTGELFHLSDYINIAEVCQEGGNVSWFRDWFVGVVEFAEKNWERPQSVFQHIPRILEDSVRSQGG